MTSGKPRQRRMDRVRDDKKKKKKKIKKDKD
jgi:hypothetical protein